MPKTISTALLVVLTNIHSADALPPFLCPSLDLASHHARQHTIHPRLNLVDKYEPGPDGHWRRTDDYTLYGSHICSSCATATTTASSASSSSTQIIAASSDAVELDLPPGWKPPDRSSTTRSNIIMSLSIVLAVLICLAASCCSHWREKRKVRLKKDDVELESISSLTLAHRRRKEEEQEIRAKKKIWALATARWKSNARFSARRRRGKRVAETLAQAQASSSSYLPGRLQRTTSSLSPSRNTSPSLRSSRAPTPTPVPLAVSRPATPSPPPTPIQPPTPPHTSADPPTTPTTINLPPAYNQSHPARPDVSPMGKPNSRRRGSENSPYTLAPETDPEITHPNEEFIPYSPPLTHTGHVATDDKTILSCLASEPPSLSPRSPAHTHPLQSSAPEWADEELPEDYDAEHSSAATPSSPKIPSSSLLFPEPPQIRNVSLLPRSFHHASDLPAKTRSNYPYYDEEEDLEYIGEPSAPPFVEEPSAPPFTEEASAPPFVLEDEIDATASQSCSSSSEEDLSTERSTAASSLTAPSTITLDQMIPPSEEFQGPTLHRSSTGSSSAQRDMSPSPEMDNTSDVQQVTGPTSLPSR